MIESWMDVALLIVVVVSFSGLSGYLFGVEQTERRLGKELDKWETVFGEYVEDDEWN